MEDRSRIKDLDFVFISYKEPNKEQNWADLKSKVPWAKRVDGVKGFDNAHKAAAEIADTDFFISVDGDNIIDNAFLLESLDWSKTRRDAVHRWRARNSVNGLVYGNGGLVGWPKETCLRMKTHENADTEENEIDFCWGVPHENLLNVYSETVINKSPLQAWTAGYREGVKMSLDRGKMISPSSFVDEVYPANLKTLCTWMSVGADVEFGKSAMLGARIGCYNTLIKGLDTKMVRELEALENWSHNSTGSIDEDLERYGHSLRQRVGIPLADYNEESSRFFKFCNNQHRNKGVQDREQK